MHKNDGYKCKFSQNESMTGHVKFGVVHTTMLYKFAVIIKITNRIINNLDKPTCVGTTGRSDPIPGSTDGW